jgi:hypothetical protein
MQILLLQLRSWVPNFQRIQNFRLHSYFNLCSSAIEVYYQDIILNEIASDESHFTFWDHFGLEITSINFGNSLLICISKFWIFNFLNEKNETPPMAFVMERSNYHGRRVLIHTTLGGNGNWFTNYGNVTKLLRDESTQSLVLQNPRSNPTDRRRTLITKERYEFE